MARTFIAAATAADAGGDRRVRAKQCRRTSHEARGAIRNRADRERHGADAAIQDVDQVHRAFGLDDRDRRRAGHRARIAATVSVRPTPIWCCSFRISTRRRGGRWRPAKRRRRNRPTPAAPTIDPGSTEPRSAEVPRALARREDIVRIGGSVSVDSDEYVRGDVVVIGGSANINGEVNGEVVVVGGSARFGPQADVRGDITVVGGGLARDPGAVTRGAINEVGFRRHSRGVGSGGGAIPGIGWTASIPSRGLPARSCASCC